MKFSFRSITCIWTISNWRRNNAQNLQKTEDFLENEEPDRRNIEYKKSTFFFFLITYSQAHLENGAFLKIFTMGQFYTIFYRENIFGISFKENNSATFFWPSIPRTRRDHKNLKICCVFLDMKKDKGLKHSLIDVIIKLWWYQWPNLVWSGEYDSKIPCL